VTSSADAAPELRDPQMVFGGPMKPAQAIIDFLSAFGLPFPLSVSLTNTEFGFRSGAKYVFPKYGFQALEHAIKNGLGVMAELELITSFGKATTSFEEAFKAAGDTKFAFVPTTMRGWHFALEFEAKILVRSITLAEIAKLFLGGAAKLEIGANAEGHTSIKYALGVSGAVEVDVGVATLKGMRTHSAVAKRLVGVREVGIGVSTEWQVEAEFLKGAAEVGVSFELAALVERTTDFHLKGEATLALDVTLGFLLHKTFEIEFEADERLAAAVFVAAMVLP
jgi:hypothetical protein